MCSHSCPDKLPRQPTYSYDRHQVSFSVPLSSESAIHPKQDLCMMGTPFSGARHPARQWCSHYPFIVTETQVDILIISASFMQDYQADREMRAKDELAAVSNDTLYLNMLAVHLKNVRLVVEPYSIFNSSSTSLHFTSQPNDVTRQALNLYLHKQQTFFTSNKKRLHTWLNG
jgi:hypothetical protein